MRAEAQLQSYIISEQWFSTRISRLFLRGPRNGYQKMKPISQSEVALIHCRGVDNFFRQFLKNCELEQILNVTFIRLIPRKMKVNSKHLVMIQIKAFLLSLSETLCPLQRFWNSPNLSSIFSIHNLENPPEKQNQLSGEGERPFRVSIPKLRMVVVTKD